MAIAAGCQTTDNPAGGEPAATGGAHATPDETAGAGGQGTAVESPPNGMKDDCADGWVESENTGDGRTTYSLHGVLPRPSLKGPTYPTCGDSPLRGAQRVYRLDLGRQPGRFKLYAALDAEFGGALVIGRGDCADLEDLICTRGVNQPKEARLSAELDPGRYFVVVRGAGLEDYGSYELQVTVEPLEADCRPASNKDCASATPLATDGRLLRTYLPVDCDYEATNEVQESRFYALDLRAEPGTTGLHAQLDFVEEAPPEDSDTEYPTLRLWGLDPSGACSATQVADMGLFSQYGRSVSTALAPGLYALELESPPARPAYLRVEFHRPDCSGNVHDTCANAEDIQLAGEQATVRGHTYCGR
ncbi:MAG TPA: hypothetical protein VFQ61_09925, partial [Polyangiaceae bacterium]|nr:hypothetical protein [Polyangiaceae bacterium]